MALIKCNKCGKEISDKSIKCVGCGYRLQKRDFKPFVIIGLVCILVIVFLIIIKNLVKDKDDHNTPSVSGTFINIVN